MQASSSEVVPFGQRLKQLLDHLKPSRNAAWLAKKSGLSASAISRLINGDRNPTMETAQCLAPVLGIEVEHLLQGTDAEERLGEPSRFILRDHYDQVVHKLVEYESTATEARRQLDGVRRSLEEAQEGRRGAEKELCSARRELAATARARDEAERRAKLLDRDLRRHRVALHKAVGEVQSLRVQVADLAQAMSQTKSSATVAKILAGVGAATGIFTVASLLRASGNDEDDYFYDEDEG